LGDTDILLAALAMHMQELGEDKRVCSMPSGPYISCLPSYIRDKLERQPRLCQMQVLSRESSDIGFYEIHTAMTISSEAQKEDRPEKLWKGLYYVQVLHDYQETTLITCLEVLLSIVVAYLVRA
jgi:hypothetical protein